ncbi:MAG TPA: bestrophin family ion channel [Sphingomicrobium sp.]|nr:bestrophin family ion channel [Sphingomicrobium sp.]
MRTIVRRYLSGVLRVVNTKSVLISGLAVLSTWLSLRFGIKADFPMTLIATAIVFPLVFSISTAYNRREKALEEYGALKANGRALALASRDWTDSGDSSRDTEIRTALHALLTACRKMVVNPLSERDEHESEVLAAFSRLSLFIELMRSAGVSATECARLNQYLARMMSAFETIKHIHKYRTPRTLRAFSDFFILLLPILYGPYFAFQAAEFRTDLFFIMPILFALILTGLSNIQDDLENPFDLIGQDDVAIDPDRYVASLDLGLSSDAPDR